jgi:hypothetical protein
MPSAYVLFVHMINIFQVPPHIVAGDAILVNTEDDCYIERLVGLLKVQAFDDKNMTLAMLFFGKMILAILLSISPSCIYEIDYCAPSLRGDICLPLLLCSAFLWFSVS